ncbi:MAG TPA: tRNA lysidine(34) synthetase TilS [Gemmatimonadaceae bacterium]|nr:tRNA lysidine(34) synthetase TilS [Gemmatimonadaceae bacterium]
MGRTDSRVAQVMDAVTAALEMHPRVVLAVSGGRDSMVMLDAAARTAPTRVAVVATFDHGTGTAASRAAAFVAERASALRFRVVRARNEHPARGEAAWREARWSFLRRTAAALDAVVATAHTRDDQLETVLMRAMRGAGARGLAALYAPSDILHPLLKLPRSAVADYARAMQVAWVDDPSNRSRAFLRNRVRMDLLPALERADPGFGDALLDVAQRAAALRRDVEHVVDTELGAQRVGRTLQVARDALARYDECGLRLLCPALVARLGLALDWRGTSRLAGFITKGRRGSQIQLSGNYVAVWHRDTLQVRPQPPATTAARGATCEGALLLGEVLEIDGWRLLRVNGRPEATGAGQGLWSAVLPAEGVLTARAWRPGDRMVPLGASTPRRVKGLLRDADIDGPGRVGWPVVLAGDEIVWIPGVRRSLAATVRPGRPAYCYRCERIDG